MWKLAEMIKVILPIGGTSRIREEEAESDFRYLSKYEFSK